MALICQCPTVMFW